jgi:hypothetical protein
MNIATLKDRRRQQELKMLAEKKLEASQLDDQAKTLAAHQPLARLAFLSLLAMVLYLATVTYTTTHLDLLLNTKVSVVWSLVELPRRWVLGVGALVLAILMYEAISLHHRVDKQFHTWMAALPDDSTKRVQRILWLHGGLISDSYSARVFGRLLSVLSSVVLYGVLWIAPLLTLTFMQAVVMPVHSEILSSAVRFSVLIACSLVGYSAYQLHSKQKLKQKDQPPRAKFKEFVNTLYSSWVKLLMPVCLIGTSLFLSLHVFLWPGEALQRAQASLAPVSEVARFV